MRILLIATRDPRGRLTGRKIALAAIVSSLERLGHEVEVVALARRPRGEGEASFRARVRHVAPPRLLRVLGNLARSFSRGRLSANECLYHSPRILRRLREHVEREGYDLVVADMIRTAPYAAALGRPWVLDLDDLLSRRYAGLAGRRARGPAIVGYYAENLPRALVPALAWAARRILRREAGILRRREEMWGRTASAVCLVGKVEADDLAARIGRPVFWGPMSVAIPPRPVGRVAERPPSLVFLGGLDYQPNVDAVRYFIEEIHPRLLRRGLEPAPLTVVGFCPDAVRAELAGTRAGPVGYVPDLGTELERHQIFLAPIVSGSGLKTKVLTAMAWGLPVVATALGAEGIGGTHGVHLCVGREADEFARWVEHLWRHPEDAARVARAGREHVSAHFAPEAVARRWSEILDAALRTRPAR